MTRTTTPLNLESLAALASADGRSGSSRGTVTGSARWISVRESRGASLTAALQRFITNSLVRPSG